MNHRTPRHRRKTLPRFTVPFSNDVVVRREALDSEGGLGPVRVNIARTCILHSPDGFECGYAGSGPADLALNILNAFVPPRGGKVRRWTDAERDDDPIRVARGIASRFALKHHQHFKFDFIANMHREGGLIPAERIRTWIDQRRVGEVDQ